MTQRAIVLDANILIRAVLGQRVRQLIVDHAANVSFFAPDGAYAEAREHLPAILQRRGVGDAAVLATLDGPPRHEGVAQARSGTRRCQSVACW